jgi:hypothetical protein
MANIGKWAISFDHRGRLARAALLFTVVVLATPAFRNTIAETASAPDALCERLFGVLAALSRHRFDHVLAHIGYPPFARSLFCGKSNASLAT